ncbi:MAG: hypothetical protein CME07_02890 [Gemmatimonadetes bacterium]|jgi:uncharacterized repeat protein (TIGR04138 family)|nr:hypothetical protein [Gemmatimonadota bacterium]
MRELLARDKRYHARAYVFVREAVAYASQVVYATGTHVSGRELLEAIRLYALDRFGLLAEAVFEEWGVRSTEDFGEIVFNLIDAEILSKTDEDSREDFCGVYEFPEVFNAGRYWAEVLETCG